MDNYIPFVRSGGIMPTTTGGGVPLVRNGGATTNEDEEDPSRDAPALDAPETTTPRGKETKKLQNINKE